jgi:hypothetical protein
MNGLIEWPGRGAVSAARLHEAGMTAKEVRDIQTPDASLPAPLPWRPGSRVARLRASHSYRTVLLMILVAFVFILAAPNENWSRAVLLFLLSATFVVARWTSGLGEGFRLGVAIAAVAAAFVVLMLVEGGATVQGLVWLLNVALVAGIAAVIALGVIDQGEINSQSVLGAICIYVLLGMFFSFLYGATAELGSGPLFAQGTDGTPSLRLYFSYVTLATLGYGDYTPAGAFGRSLTVVEALTGQLYLVTVIALIVGNLGRKRDAPR